MTQINDAPQVRIYECYCPYFTAMRHFWIELPNGHNYVVYCYSRGPVAKQSSPIEVAWEDLLYGPVRWPDLLTAAAGAGLYLPEEIATYIPEDCRDLYQRS